MLPQGRTKTVYLLKDPRTGLPRYVGCSLDVQTRLKEHDKKRGTRTQPLYGWLNELHAVAMSPVVDILEAVPESDWERAEQKWISHFREINAPILNVANGGKGTPGNKLSNESRGKIAKSRIGKPQHPNATRALAEYWRHPRSMSESARQRISETHKGKTVTDETRKKISAAKKGTKATPEAKRNMSLARKGKMSESHKRALFAGRVICSRCHKFGHKTCGEPS